MKRLAFFIFILLISLLALASCSGNGSGNEKYKVMVSCDDGAKVDGENLRFEDGTLGKFWGVNFNGGACFPSKEYAPKVAQRLAQAGCNIVRFHQLDAE